MLNCKKYFVFELLNRQYHEESKIGVLRRVIQVLSDRHDGFLRELSKVEFRKRRIVAREPLELNPDRPDLLVEKHSERLPGGYWLYKNVSEEHAVACMVKACETAGIQYGADLKLLSENWKLRTLSLDEVWARLGLE